MTNPRKLWSAVALAVTLALGLSSCTGSAIAERDPAAHARLAPDTGDIILPLSDYLVIDTVDDQLTFQAATRSVIGTCMRDAGYAFSAAGVSEDPLSYPGDWTYGFWGRDRLARYGPPGTAPSRADAAVARDQGRGGSGWAEHYAACADQVAIDGADFLPSTDDVNSTLAARLATEAYNAALKDPAWAQARERWRSCLTENDLTAPTDERSWNSRESDSLVAAGHTDTEPAVRAATIEAGCNDDTHLAQTLGDLEAAYQQPLIEDNEAALATEKTHKQDMLAAARQYVSTHG